MGGKTPSKTVTPDALERAALACGALPTATMKDHIGAKLVSLPVLSERLSEIVAYANEPRGAFSTPGTVGDAKSVLEKSHIGNPLCVVSKLGREFKAASAQPSSAAPIIVPSVAPSTPASPSHYPLQKGIDAAGKLVKELQAYTNDKIQLLVNGLFNQPPRSCKGDVAISTVNNTTGIAGRLCTATNAGASISDPEELKRVLDGIGMKLQTSPDGTIKAVSKVTDDKGQVPENFRQLAFMLGASSVTPENCGTGAALPNGEVPVSRRNCAATERALSR